jgi:hypothetical protein
MCCNYTVIWFVKLCRFYDGCCKLEVCMRGLMACRFHVAHLVVKNPRFVAASRFAFGVNVRCPAFECAPTSARRAVANVRFLWPHYGLAPHQRFALRSTHDRRIAPGMRLLRPNHGSIPLRAVFFLRSTRDRRSIHDRRIAPGVRLLRPNHGPAPRQAVFSSVNSRPTVTSRPTHRSRRALASAESWPCPASSGFLFGQLETDGQLTTDASLQACACFGRIMALPRVKRFPLRSRQ